MEMAGRGFSGSYRFGYQGSEKDNEVSGDGNSYTTEFRQLDPRLGRWFSVDPVFQPWQSPYSSMDNDPINLNDPMGDEAVKDGDKGKSLGENHEENTPKGNSEINYNPHGGKPRLEGGSKKNEINSPDNLKNENLNVNRFSVGNKITVSGDFEDKQKNTDPTWWKKMWKKIEDGCDYRKHASSARKHKWKAFIQSLPTFKPIHWPKWEIVKSTETETKTKTVRFSVNKIKHGNTNRAGGLFSRTLNLPSVRIGDFRDWKGKKLDSYLDDAEKSGFTYGTLGGRTKANDAGGTNTYNMFLDAGVLNTTFPAIIPSNNSVVSGTVTQTAASNCFDVCRGYQLRFTLTYTTIETKTRWKIQRKD